MDIAKDGPAMAKAGKGKNGGKTDGKNGEAARDVPITDAPDLDAPVLVNQTWVPTGAMATARDSYTQVNLTAVRLMTGKVLVMGGHAGASYLTGAEWNWEKVYRMFVEKAQKGEPLPNFVRGGLAEGFIKMSPYGPAVPEAARKQADAVKAEILKGGYAVFKGPLKDNKGKEVVAAGKAYQETTIELESMDYLVNGVVGSTA